MKVRIVISLVLGFVLGSAGVAWAQDFGEARDRFIRSSAAAEAALEQAQREVAPEGRSAIERALGEVRVARERTLEELRRAEGATGAGSEGRARAREAVDRGTLVHLQVLQDVFDKVPSQAKAAIQHALEVSRTGREAALGALGDGGARLGPPAVIRSGPPSGVPPGPPDSIGGPPSGIPGGPSRGRPGR